MDILTCDFETYYDAKYKLKNRGSGLTIEEYVRDPRFEIIGVSVKKNDGETQWCSGELDQLRLWIRGFDVEHSYLLAHNTAFDGFILRHVFGLKPSVYGDTMAMGQLLYGVEHRVGLGNLSVLLGCGVKGDEVVKAKGKHRADFSDMELEAYGEYCCNDVDLTHRLFHLMLPEFSKRELKLIDLTLRMFCDPVLGMDEGRLQQYLIQVRERKKYLLDQCGVDKADLLSNEKFAGALRRFGVEPPMKTSLRTGLPTYALAKTDEGFKELLDHPREEIQILAAARLGNKSTLAETRTQSFIGIAQRGTYPFSIRYAGAAVTHRWSGFDLNPQNLPRKSELRKAILAPKGCVIVVADLKAIELRLGFWLAGEEQELELIRRGLDTYRKSAEDIEGTPYDQVGDDLRFIFKTVNLSGIFGVGAKKMQASLKQGVGGISVYKPVEEIEEVVATFRNRHPNLTKAWRQGEEFLRAIANNRYVAGFKNNIIETCEGGLRKPSGMVLKYPQLQQIVENNKFQWIYYRIGKYATATPDRVYGAKVYQRCVQSLARDILAGHMLSINRRFRVVGTVHDEILAVAPISAAEECKAYMHECMSTPPSWAPDLPLEAEIGYDECYSK